MTRETETVHVAYGISRADAIREALRLQGCEERVIALPATLSHGPIDPPDPIAREAWVRTNLRCGSYDDWREPEEPWAEVTAPDVHPVHWVCLTDAGEHACFLEFASRMTGRPFDIIDATGVDFAGVSRVSRVWSLGQLRPEEIVASGLRERRRAFTDDDSRAAMADWARLRRENAPLRVVRDGRLVSAPLTHFDPILIEQASPVGEMLIELVARLLHHLDAELGQPGQGCSYELLFARILVLGEAGALEVTGPGPGMRDFMVHRRPGRGTAPEIT